jgi:hypothetical protein
MSDARTLRLLKTSGQEGVIFPSCPDLKFLIFLDMLKSYLLFARIPA